MNGAGISFLYIFFPFVFSFSQVISHFSSVPFIFSSPSPLALPPLSLPPLSLPPLPCLPPIYLLISWPALPPFFPPSALPIFSLFPS